MMAPGRAEALDVLVNASVAQEEIGIGQLYAIFTGRSRYWDDGSSITVVMYREDVDVQKEFCRDILDMPARKLRFSWNYVSFAGIGREPIIVESKQEMLDKINSIPHSIGFVDLLDDQEGDWYVLEIK